MRTLIALTIFTLLVAIVYTQGPLPFRYDTGTTPPELTCAANTDCVPLPVCHPHACIPRAALSLYPPAPEICTLIFDPEAAYSPEDCECTDNRCRNKNLGRNLSETEGSASAAQASSAQ